MRLAGLRSSLFVAFTVLMAGAIAGCDNPFDPLSKSDKIQGLTYFDFSASQEHWDSDPEWDGLQITLNYKNEFGDALNFHDKPHQVTIELWSQEEATTGTGTTTTTVRGSLLASKTISYSNSDDLIRIPIEYYAGALSIADPPEAITGYMLVRVYPPQESPRKELVGPIAEVDLYTPEDIL